MAQNQGQGQNKPAKDSPLDQNQGQGNDPNFVPPGQQDQPSTKPVEPDEGEVNNDLPDEPPTAQPKG